MRHQCFRSLGQNRTHAYSITVLFPIWVYAYALFFKINCFLLIVNCLMLVFLVITMQTFDFKTNIIAIKLFLVMILNLYLTSE